MATSKFLHVLYTDRGDCPPWRATMYAEALFIRDKGQIYLPISLSHTYTYAFSLRAVLFLKKEEVMALAIIFMVQGIGHKQVPINLVFDHVMAWKLPWSL